MSSTSQRRKRDSSKTAPIKLCSACTNCNAAKVKCSGAKDGCDRCRNLDLSCVYTESRVGKVPGTRAKKPQTQNAASSYAPQSADDSPSPKISQPRVAALTPPLSNGFDEGITNWAVEMESHIPSDLDSFDHNNHTFITSSSMDQSMPTPITNLPMNSSGNDFSVPSNLDFTIEDFNPSQTDMCSHHGLVPTSAPVDSHPLPSSQHTARQAEADSHCVFNLTQMIGNLERYIFMELKALDIVLGVTKRCVTQLRKLASLQKHTDNFRCKALFSIVMDQIIILLEAGCSSFSNNSGPFAQAQGPSGRLNGVSNLPSIGFGTFQLDEEEQKTWQIQIVTKELHSSLELLYRIEAISTRDSAHGGREAWSNQFASRLTALLDKVSGQA